MRKGIFFNVGLILIIIGILSGIILIVATKENKFKQDTIGSYDYQIIDKFYSLELERNSLIQAGRLSLLYSLNASLELGINENCEKYESVSLWTDSCYPTQDILKQSILSKILTPIKYYQNTSFYKGDNYAFNLYIDNSSLILFGRGYSLMNYDLESSLPAVKGNPNIGSNLQQTPQEYSSKTDSLNLSKKQPPSCPPPQRPLPRHYLEAFSKYQDLIYAAANKYSVEPELIAALMTKETSFGTNSMADRADDYGNSLKDGIPDYIAGCRVCYIDGCLDHSTVSDPSKSTWRAPPNKPGHNIMCAAERINAYLKKISKGDHFGCLKDSRYTGDTEEMIVKKLACTYNSGSAKYSYADEVYKFYLQWKDVLCQKAPVTSNKITGNLINNLISENLLSGNVIQLEAPKPIVYQRHTIYGFSPNFVSTVFFNYSIIDSIVKESKLLIENCRVMNFTSSCFQNVTFYDSSCKSRYLVLPPIKLNEPLKMIFCVPIKSSLLHGPEFNIKFALPLQSVQSQLLTVQQTINSQTLNSQTPQP